MMECSIMRGVQTEVKAFALVWLAAFRYGAIQSYGSNSTIAGDFGSGFFQKVERILGFDFVSTFE